MNIIVNMIFFVGFLFSSTFMSRFAAGSLNSSFIDPNGHIWVTGISFFGSDNDDESLVKTGDNTFVSIITGHSDTFLIDEEKGLWCFGRNIGGLLSVGDSKPRNTFTNILNIPKVDYVTCSSVHALILVENGKVWSCGVNSNGQLGHGDIIPRNNFEEIQNLANIKAISCAGSYSLVLDNQGDSWIFGKQEEIYIISYSSKKIPFKIPNICKMKGIVAGGTHMILISEDDKVFACGESGFPEIPYCIEDITDKIDYIPSIKQVFVGWSTTMILDTSGGVWVFGDNQSRALGIGDIPIVDKKFDKITGIPEIVDIALGICHSLFLDVNGYVWGCGSSERNELGQPELRKYQPFLRPIKLENIPCLRASTVKRP